MVLWCSQIMCSTKVGLVYMCAFCGIYGTTFLSAQVEEFVRKETASSRVWQLPEAELAAYAHYVQSVTLGGELIASITITNPGTVEYRLVYNGPFTPSVSTNAATMLQ